MIRLTPQERVTLRKVDRQHHFRDCGDRSSTLRSLELRGLIRKWPSAQPELTASGRAWLAEFDRG